MDTIRTVPLARASLTNAFSTCLLFGLVKTYVFAPEKKSGPPVLSSPRPPFASYRTGNGCAQQPFSHKASVSRLVPSNSTTENVNPVLLQITEEERSRVGVDLRRRVQQGEAAEGICHESFRVEEVLCDQC